MQYGKGVGILSGGRGEEQRQTAGFGAAKLCVLLILTELSQKIRRPAIESPHLACIIGLLGTHCPHKEGGTVAPGGAAEKRSDKMEKFSVKKPFTVLVAVIMVLMLGFVSIT